MPSKNFISEVWSGKDLTDVYLKHPANESSEDEEGEEEVNPHDSGEINNLFYSFYPQRI